MIKSLRFQYLQELPMIGLKSNDLTLKSKLRIDKNYNVSHIYNN